MKLWIPILFLLIVPFVFASVDINCYKSGNPCPVSEDEVVNVPTNLEVPIFVQPEGSAEYTLYLFSDTRPFKFNSIDVDNNENIRQFGNLFLINFGGNSGEMFQYKFKHGEYEITKFFQVVSCKTDFRIFIDGEPIQEDTTVSLEYRDFQLDVADLSKSKSPEWFGYERFMST